ncbi:MAG TPA: hybrid sensor histidine kinase/response regulator [Cyanothece sp. UBA12306]|nr:hybrid sensor histidine kinase/response regulator [Cyanothece sp. UBA12306]
MMPEMDGYEVCQQLKLDQRTKDIPVIFVSAIDEVLDKVKAFAVGGVDYMTKPIQEQEVFARIETHLQIRRLQENLEEKNQKLQIALRQVKQAQNQLIQSEKMAALGQLIAGISHEINTPLGAINSSIQNLAAFFKQDIKTIWDFWTSIAAEDQAYFFDLLNNISPSNLSSREKRQIKRKFIQQLETQGIQQADYIADTLVDLGISAEKIELFIPLFRQAKGIEILDKAYQFFSLKKSTETIKSATDRADKIIFPLKSYARYDLGTEKRESDLIHGIETVLTLYHNQIKQGVEIIKNYTELPPILCYPDELIQVWTNLIHNALQAMEYQGQLMIDVQRENELILTKITDNGPGIPEKIMPRIFEPFFTTKIAGEGSGLGLDIVERIIDKHQGTIEVKSCPGKTTFIVYLPLILKGSSAADKNFQDQEY